MGSDSRDTGSLPEISASAARAMTASPVTRKHLLQALDGQRFEGHRLLQVLLPCCAYWSMPRRLALAAWHLGALELLILGPVVVVELTTAAKARHAQVFVATRLDRSTYLPFHDARWRVGTRAGASIRPVTSSSETTLKVHAARRSFLFCNHFSWSHDTRPLRDMAAGLANSPSRASGGRVPAQVYPDTASPGGAPARMFGPKRFHD